MIMKRYIAILTSVLALGILFSGCKKDEILNGDPYTSFVKSNYFTSEKNVELFANYFYSEWTGYGNGGGYGSSISPP